MRTLFFLKLKLRFLAQQKTRNGVFRPPPGSWLPPLGIQIDPRASADAVDERNGLHQSARPQADVDKKTEFSLLKKRSEILVPLRITTPTAWVNLGWLMLSYLSYWDNQQDSNTQF